MRLCAMCAATKRKTHNDNGHNAQRPWTTVAQLVHAQRATHKRSQRDRRERGRGSKQHFGVSENLGQCGHHGEDRRTLGGLDGRLDRGEREGHTRIAAFRDQL